MARKKKSKKKAPPLQLVGEQFLAEAIDRSGASYVLSVPGLPGRDLMEYLIQKTKLGKKHWVQWSINSRTAIDTAAGMTLSGWWVAVVLRGSDFAATLDTLQTLSLVRTRGALLVIVGDDPAAWVSYNNVDSRQLAAASNLPVLELEQAQDSFPLIRKAFEWSESFELPIVLRYTSALNLQEDEFWQDELDIVRHPRKFRTHFHSPVLSCPENVLENQTLWRKRLQNIKDAIELEHLAKKFGHGKKGIITSGYLFSKVLEVTSGKLDPYFSLLSISSVYPIPETAIGEFLQSVDEIMVLEEGEPLVERQVLECTRAQNWKGSFWGKTNQKVPSEGEIFKWEIEELLTSWEPEFETEEVFFPYQEQQKQLSTEGFCESCSFPEVLKSFQNAIAATLDNQKPLVVADSGCILKAVLEFPEFASVTLSSGSAIGVAAGMATAQKGKTVIAITGDTSFYHSGIQHLINATFNQYNVFVLVMDNSVSAQTGFQPNPGSGRDVKGKEIKKIEKDDLLFAAKADYFRVVKPDDSDALQTAFQEGLLAEGVRVVVVEQPCDLFES